MGNKRDINTESAPREALNEMLDGYRQAAQKELYAAMYHTNVEAKKAGLKPAYSDETMQHNSVVARKVISDLPTAFSFDVNEFLSSPKLAPENGQPYKPVDLKKIIPADMAAEIAELRGESGNTPPFQGGNMLGAPGRGK
jgi:hypothetical protein